MALTGTKFLCKFAPVLRLGDGRDEQDSRGLGFAKAFDPRSSSEVVG